MDQQELILDPPLTFCNFFSRLVYRFLHGNAPYSPQGRHTRIPPYQFSFDSHPGPLADAISDARNLRRSIFLFVYSQDNPATAAAVAVLQQPAVVAEMRENFIFLPLDVTWPEGWEIATQLRFKMMPLIALIRPRGATLAESQIFVSYEGRVGESTLLSSMRVEHHNPDAGIIQDQDDEYNQAVLIDQENVRRVMEEIDLGETIAVERQIEERGVTDEFERIPEPVDQNDRAIIRFQFPGGIQSETRKFSRAAPVRWVFVFVRKFMFPKRFVLLTGFPQVRIEESQLPLGDVLQERQFIVHVQEEEDDE
jgi:hypothetical protein